MSSPDVRRAIYSALPALLPDFVYVPTLNVEVDQSALPDGHWYTVDFQAFEAPRVSLGRPGCFLERGVVLVTLAAPSAEGDLPLADMAEQFRTEFLDWFEPTAGAIRIYQVNPPLEVDAGDLRGAWWLIEVAMDYEYHRH